MSEVGNTGEFWVNALPDGVERDLPGGKKVRLGFLALIVAAAVLPYLGVLDAPFVFDDVKLVKDNELIRVEGEEARTRIVGSFNIASQQWKDAELRENYRPLRFLSYWIDYRLSVALLDDFPADDPPVLFFHLQNILWHALNAFLLFFIGRRLLGSDFGGLSLALLFAVHPLATEAVTYMSSRRDVLSTFFFLAALGLYVGSPRQKPLSWLALIAAPILFGLGFLAKEMVITLPALFLLIDILRRPLLEPRRILCHVAMWSVAACLIWLTMRTPDLVREDVAPGAGGVLSTACSYAARYLGLALAPFSLSVDYSFDAISPSRALFDPWTTVPALLLVLALLVTSVFAWRRGRGIIALSILWFLGVLVPVLQFVPTAERFAERFAYVPMIGVLLLAAAGFVRWRRKEPVSSWSGLGVVAFVLLAMTVHRNGDWGSRLDLWTSAVAAQPRCARAHMGLGDAMHEAGKARGAIDEFSRAIEIWEEDLDPSPLLRGHLLRARSIRGSLYVTFGRRDPASVENAIADLSFVLASTDTDGQEIESSTNFVHNVVHLELASCFELLETFDRAIHHYRRIIDIGAHDDLVFRSLYEIHRLHLKQGKHALALEMLDEMLAFVGAEDPRWKQTQLHVFEALMAKKDPKGAQKLAETLLGIAESDNERIAYLLRIARSLDAQGELDACTVRLEEALVVDPSSASALLSLGPIEVMRKNWDHAEEIFRRVLEKDPFNSRATQGLKNIALQKSLDADPEGGKRELRKQLESMAVSAEKHHDEDEWDAARKSWLKVLEKAVELNERDYVARAYREISRAEVRLHRYEQAMRPLEQAAKLDEGLTDTQRAIGDLALRYLKDPKRAERAYREYVLLLPDGAPGDARVFLNLASLVAKEEPDAAIVYLLRARSIGVDGILEERAATVDKRLGLLYAEIGEWKKSFAALNKYLEALPDVDVAERLAIEKLLNEKVLPGMLESSERP